MPELMLHVRQVPVLGSMQVAIDALSDPRWTDAFVTIAILASSVGCVLAALWLAQCLSLDRLFVAPKGSKEAWKEPKEWRVLRSILGLLALAGSISMMLGLLPGTAFLGNPIHAAACLGTAFLGILTIVKAWRIERTDLNRGATNWSIGDRTPARRAA